MMLSFIWAVRLAGGCCCCCRCGCCLLSVTAASRGGDVSKVNRKGSFSFPMMEKKKAKVSEDCSGGDDTGAPAETEREPLGCSEQPAGDCRG